MIQPRIWFDGLRARIAAALLAALLIQFVGSEIIFEQVESARVERGRAQRLADWLSFADKFADTRPDAIERMNEMWEPRLAVTYIAPRNAVSSANGNDARLAEMVVTAQPELGGMILGVERRGDALHGSLRLSDGRWLGFRSEDYFERNSQTLHYAASVLLLLTCVILIALFFGGMVARPLAGIARAAERVGREEAVPITVEGPREVRQVAAAFDRMQTRLLAHVRDRLQSLAAMSHDLRTPLARLRLNASTVEDSETRAALEQDVAEMEAFVTSVLDYLRGDDPEPEQPADIASIAMTVVDETLDTGAEAIYEGPHRLESVTRPLKLKRLIRNIVQNAVRHAGNARVSLSEGAGVIIITVEDDGPGIPETKLETVFEPFTRLDISRSRSTGGAGLGLAIGRQLSDRLGGSIRLHNRPEGGLSVVITLPR